ncbi:hypothetical protein ACKTEK_07115 [Tepidamorphus sp. 3E244]|uniref:hypothetical protein n=1 Tax=Tepidamorphus sp. 3E244 TaxID=3385498 RepID=UPI0038FD2943
MSTEPKYDAETKALIEEYWNARQEMRAATESPMVESSEPGDRMQAIADKLSARGVDLETLEEEGASTL